MNFELGVRSLESVAFGDFELFSFEFITIKNYRHEETALLLQGID